jgi:hypothetical protein
MKPLPLTLSLAGMAVIWLADLTQTLGAHPWWSGKVVLIGAPVGLGLALALGRVLTPRGRAALFAAATLAAVWVATTGKAGFTASYAEDRFAGQMWYFGWIATAAALAGLIYAVAALVGPRKARPPLRRPSSS